MQETGPSPFTTHNSLDQQTAPCLSSGPANRGRPLREALLAWKVVDVAAVHEQVAIFGVAEGRQVPGEGHARPHIAPQRACHTGEGGRGNIGS